MRLKRWYAHKPTVNARDPIFSHCDVVSGGTRIAKVAGIGDDEAFERACLIAAAPEILSALEDCVDAFRDTAQKDRGALYQKASTAYEKARAAIARAKGAA